MQCIILQYSKTVHNMHVIHTKHQLVMLALYSQVVTSFIHGCLHLGISPKLLASISWMSSKKYSIVTFVDGELKSFLASGSNTTVSWF